MTRIDRRTLLVAAGGLLAATACGTSSPASTTTPKGQQQTMPSGSGVSREVESYGDQELQRGEWFLPSGNDPAPTVVLIHGGYWRAQYDRSLEVPVALDLAQRGYLVWNIDYRPSTYPYPATLSDVAAAYDHLTASKHTDRIDRRRVAVVGHSAGGHLAAWTASRPKISSGAPGAEPLPLRPALFVPQAGVVCLALAAEQSLGSDAPQALLGGTPTSVPDRYREADPLQLLPTGIRSVLIHGSADDVVPLSQSQTYTRAATQHRDNSTLDIVPGDHFVHLDPTSEACAKLRAALASMPV